MVLASRKAHPDEKGTESLQGDPSPHHSTGRKAHPDEKGTESRPPYDRTSTSRWVAKHIPMRRELKAVICKKLQRSDGNGRKAHPDEKGTESSELTRHYSHMIPVAKHIPMRRELKVS